MSSELSVDHLLGIKYLQQEDIELIFKTADHFKEVINRPIKKYHRLETLPLQTSFSKIVQGPDFLLNWQKKG